MMFRSVLDCVRRRSSPSRRRSASCRMAVEVLEDRCTPTTALLDIGDVTVLEGNDGVHKAEVPVTLSRPRSSTVSVEYSAAGAAISGRLTFSRGQTTRSILIPVLGDRLAEPDEYFSIRLFNARGARIADGVGTITILDDEPRINVGSWYANETNSSTTPFTFRVSLSAEYDQTVTVKYTTMDGSATADSDYVAAEGTVTFVKGEPTFQDITVWVNGDHEVEPNEAFSVKLSDASSNAQISSGVGTGTIYDDEPRISIGDTWQNYGEATITFTVSLSAAPDELVWVDFETVDGTAIEGVDYVAKAGSLTFDDMTPMLITVDLLDSTSSDKYFYVHLTGASANAQIANEWAAGYWYYDYWYYDPGWGYYDYYYYYYW